MKKLLMLIFMALVALSVIPSARAVSPTLTDFWNGKAKLQFVRALTAVEMQQGHITNMGPGFSAGVRVKVIGDVWYLFMRRIETEIPTPDYCPQRKSNLLSVVVSKSVDEGRTWSKPVRIISPAANTPWECGATDGDAIYNAKTHQWHYLFQCLSRKGWQGCYAKRSGDDPMGEFEIPTSNPAIPAGAIWSKICDLRSDECTRIAGGLNKIHDEGTFDIFDFRGGYYFVDFHGYDGVNGYRGIAKTKNFKKWVVVASDATLNKEDALSFKTPWDKKGPIGFGAGVITKGQGYFYLIAEAADKNLGCTPGQNWVWGLFRSKRLSNTRWEQYKENPFFTAEDFPAQDAHPLPCNPAYAGFFTSNMGKVYFHASLPSHDPHLDGIYFYELVFQ